MFLNMYSIFTNIFSFNRSKGIFLDLWKSTNSDREVGSFDFFGGKSGTRREKGVRGIWKWTVRFFRRRGKEEELCLAISTTFRCYCTRGKFARSLDRSSVTRS